MRQYQPNRQAKRRSTPYWVDQDSPIESDDTTTTTPLRLKDVLRDEPLSEKNSYDY